MAVKRLFLLLLPVLLLLGAAPPPNSFTRVYSNFDRLLAGIPTSDNGYLLIAEINSDEYYLGDSLIVKLDATGKVTWKRIVSNTLKDHMYFAAEMPDHGFVVAGDTYECPMSRTCIAHPLVIRFGPTGNVRWKRTFAASEADAYCCSSGTVDAAGNIVLLGSTHYSGAPDVLVVKMDPSGNIVWSQSFGGPGYDYGRAVMPACGGWMVLGDSDYTDLFAFRVSAYGKLTWSRKYGTEQGEYLKSAAPAGNCRFYMLAQRGVRSYVMLIDREGRVIWKRALFARGANVAAASVRSDHGPLVAGSSTGRGVVLKLDEAGNPQWGSWFKSGVAGRVDFAAGAAETGYRVAGEILAPSWRHFVARLDASGMSFGCPLFEPVAVTTQAPVIRVGPANFAREEQTFSSANASLRITNRALESSPCIEP